MGRASQGQIRGLWSRGEMRGLLNPRALFAPPKKKIVLVLARNIQDGDGDVCVCAVLWIVHLSLAYARTILQDTNSSTDYSSSHKHTNLCVFMKKKTRN